LSGAIQKLLNEANRLGFLVTREALGEFLLEVARLDPTKVTLVGTGEEQGFYFRSAGLNHERTRHHIESIYSTLKAELRTTL